jgi:glutathione S-transferase
VGTDSQQAKLYVILGSHACRTGMLMLEHKGIPYRTVTIPTGTQRLMPVLRFPHGTVPALVIDGRRVQKNRKIARALDELQPEPLLFPHDEPLRAKVEEAERWGDEVFQMAARRTVLAAALHGPEMLIDRGDRGRLGPLLWRRARTRLIGARAVGRMVFNVNPRTENELLATLPGLLDRIDAWIEDGVLNGEQLHAADYIVAPSVALLMYRRDLRPEIERRPAAALADRVLPEPS